MIGAPKDCFVSQYGAAEEVAVAEINELFRLGLWGDVDLLLWSTLDNILCVMGDCPRGWGMGGGGWGVWGGGWENARSQVLDLTFQ